MIQFFMECAISRNSNKKDKDSFTSHLKAEHFLLVFYLKFLGPEGKNL